MSTISRELSPETEAPTVTFVLDGREMTALPGETLIEIADREGIEIPRLCYKPGMEAVGNCRSCMVEIKGTPPATDASKNMATPFSLAR